MFCPAKINIASSNIGACNGSLICQLHSEVSEQEELLQREDIA